jgi:hypothetical protein
VDLGHLLRQRENDFDCFSGHVRRLAVGDLPRLQQRAL